MAVYNSDLHITGTLTPQGGLRIPDGSLVNAQVADTAAIENDKVELRQVAQYHQAGTVVDAERPIYWSENAASVIGGACIPRTVTTGGDLAYTVDLKVNGTTSILTAPVTIDSGSSAMTGVLFQFDGTPTLEADDRIHVEIVTSGTTGTQGEDLSVQLKITGNQQVAVVDKEIDLTANGATSWFYLDGGDTHIHLEGVTDGATVTVQTTLDPDAASPVEVDSDGEKIFESVDTLIASVVKLSDIWVRVNVSGGGGSLAAKIRFRSVDKV